jgi:hypothetical protein
MRTSSRSGCSQAIPMPTSMDTPSAGVHASTPSTAESNRVGSSGTTRLVGPAWSCVVSGTTHVRCSLVQLRRDPARPWRAVPGRPADLSALPPIEDPTHESDTKTRTDSGLLGDHDSRRTHATEHPKRPSQGQTSARRVVRRALSGNGVRDTNDRGSGRHPRLARSHLRAGGVRNDDLHVRASHRRFRQLSVR